MVVAAFFNTTHKHKLKIKELKVHFFKDLLQVAMDYNGFKSNSIPGKMFLDEPKATAFVLHNKKFAILQNDLAFNDPSQCLSDIICRIIWNQIFIKVL